jgi:hypothetical protein
MPQNCRSLPNVPPCNTRITNAATCDTDKTPETSYPIKNHLIRQNKPIHARKNSPLTPLLNQDQPQMLSPDFLLHPITLYFIQKPYIIYALAFHPSLPTRLGFLILILICLYASYATYLDKLPRGVVASIASGTTFADVLQYPDLVILSGRSFDDDGAPVVFEGQTRYPSGAANAEADGTKKAKAASVKSSASLLSDLYQRLQYGCFISSAPRLIGTKHQVKNVPPYKTSNQAYIPSRTSFLLRKALTICVCYLPFDLATSTAKPAENHISYSVDKIPFFSRLGDVDGAEISKKLVEGAGYWTASYCTM